MLSSAGVVGGLPLLELLCCRDGGRVLSHDLWAWGSGRVSLFHSGPTLTQSSHLLEDKLESASLQI